ncbi:MAG: hypothetical protein Q7R90_03820 [bacterium]|nr:hypothetical protein [bacterium]
MFDFFKEKTPQRRGLDSKPIKPGNLNYQMQKAEIAKEQAEATRQKNQAKIHTVSGYAERSLDDVAKGASELKAAATPENVNQSFRDAADAASDALDAIEKEEGKREQSE